MKKTLYILLAFLVVVGCNEDNSWDVDNPDVVGKDEVKITFSTDVLNYQETRATQVNENTIENLAVLVFDKEEGYQYKRMASLVSQSGYSEYEVTLKKSIDPKSIHFVANMDWTDFDSKETEYIGWPDTEVINQLSTKEGDYIGMWQRVEMKNGINENTTELSSRISLIRNVAKVSVELESAASEVFTLENMTLIHTPDLGTIAPFNRTTHQFDENSIIEANNIELKDVPAEGADGKFLAYAFEREEELEEKKYSALILEGMYGDVKTFYKVALIDDDNLVESILKRNYYYKVRILRIQKQGSNSFEESKNGLADNNISLELALEKYPIITYGDEKLEVEKYHFVITDNAKLTLNTWAKYWKKNVETNSLLRIVNVQENDPANPVFKSRPQISNGKITASLNKIPQDGSIRVAKMVINPEGSKLSRVIKVTLKQPFTFQPTSIQLFYKNGSAVPEGELIKNQGDKARILFTIPDDKNLMYPFEVYIYTKWMVPAMANSELLYEWIESEDRAKYTMIVSEPKTYVLDFQMIEGYNESSMTPAENFIIESNQFVTATLPYNKTIKRYSFKGYYQGLITQYPLSSNSADKNQVVVTNGSDVFYSGEFESNGGGDCSVKLPVIDASDQKQYSIQLKYNYRGWPMNNYQYYTNLMSYDTFMQLINAGKRVVFE